ncbi:c-type heme family protein [Petrachloros mirabilis]
MGDDQFYKFQFSKHSHIRLKQTPLNPCNSKNEPDGCESSVLTCLSGQPRAEAYVSGLTGSGQNLRVVIPNYNEKVCLGCHVEPK